LNFAGGMDMGFFKGAFDDVINSLKNEISKYTILSFKLLTIA